MPITTTPSGGPQGEFSTYTPIYAQTLSSATASVTFSNIPTTYTDLVLVFQGTVATNGQSIIVRFNSDSGSNYSRTHLRGTSTSSESVRVSSTTASWLSYGAGVSSTAQCGGTMTIQNYANTTTYKPVLTKFSNVSGSAGAGIEYGINGWMSTSAITSLTIAAQSGNMNSGCMFTLYGIKAAAPAPKATGGDVVVTDGTYWYHAFKTTGLFDVKQSLTADILVVAGGGGGAGWYYAGGGGAGGLLAYTNQSLTTASYTCTVGAGGAGGGTGVYRGTNGINSTFGALTSAAGGGGGGNAQGSNQIGSDGGSGGGAGSTGDNVSPGAAGGTATPAGQGNNGGRGFIRFESIGAGGGGGGAGAAGSNGASSTGGNGGAGVNTYSSWASATGTGSSGYYAGGGGGGGASSGGSGGSGGGAAGRGGFSAATGLSGTSNTGGGGGGANNDTSIGGSGGSGVIIVRYAV